MYDVKQRAQLVHSSWAIFTGRYIGFTTEVPTLFNRSVLYVRFPHFILGNFLEWGELHDGRVFIACNHLTWLFEGVVSNKESTLNHYTAIISGGWQFYFIFKVTIYSTFNFAILTYMSYVSPVLSASEWIISRFMALYKCTYYYNSNDLRKLRTIFM